MFLLEQFQLEHGRIVFSEQIAPLVRLRNEVWTMWNRERVLTGRGLARRPLSAGECTLNWPHTLRSVYTISHTTQTEMCADFKSERRGTENISQCSQSERLCTKNLFREHFAGVVYREHIWTGPKSYSKISLLWKKRRIKYELFNSALIRYIVFLQISRCNEKMKEEPITLA